MQSATGNERLSLYAHAINFTHMFTMARCLNKIAFNDLVVDKLRLIHDLISHIS